MIEFEERKGFLTHFTLPTISDIKGVARLSVARLGVARLWLDSK